LNNFTRSGILFVVSAPSGTGKTTLCTNVRQTPDLVYSVSCTTRPQRPGEKDGVDYYFLSKDDFEKKMKKGEMLEHADVYGHYYGTPKGPVLEHLAAGRVV
jgi:guanylate kinase